MKYANNQERFFFGSIGNQVIANRLKTKRPRSEVSSTVPLVGKRDELAHSVEDVFTDAPSCKKIIFGNVFPDFTDVQRSTRVQFKTLGGCHFCGRFLSNPSSRARRLSKKASPSMGLTRPLLMSS